MRLNPFEKLKNNPLSLRAAINAKCYDCIGRYGDPDWRGSIRGFGKQIAILGCGILCE